MVAIGFLAALLFLLPWEKRHTYEIGSFALCCTPATIIASSRHHALVADDIIGRNCRLKLNVP
jgi:hypothetical protein